MAMVTNEKQFFIFLHNNSVKFYHEFPFHLEKNFSL